MHIAINSIILSKFFSHEDKIVKARVKCQIWKHNLTIGLNNVMIGTKALITLMATKPTSKVPMQPNIVYMDHSQLCQK